MKRQLLITGLLWGMSLGIGLPVVAETPVYPLTSSREPLSPTEVRILSPVTGSSGDRKTHLILHYHRDSELSIQLNGNPLPQDTRTTLEEDTRYPLNIQIWYNLPLQEGENTISVAANGGNPRVVTVKVEDNPTPRVQLYPMGDPFIPADGRSTVVLEGRVKDQQGNPILTDTLVTLTSTAGEFVGEDANRDQPGWQILAQNGVFRTSLRSSLNAQPVKIRAAIATTPNSEAFTQIQFTTHLRPSLVSGILDLRIGQAGLDFWGRRENYLSLNNSDSDITLNGAIFATGTIGEWLLTGAYNSDRALNENCTGNPLFRAAQFCNDSYAVYGDSSTTHVVTPSIDSVYLRLERTSPVMGAEPDFLLWGDYPNPEFARTSQQLSAQNRPLHGFKGNFNLGNLQLSALYSPNVDGFQRDTLLPDGTSGYYFLSRRDLVEGSETLIIEHQPVNRPGTIVKQEPLTRGQDYEIDYDRGTILFRQPQRSFSIDLYGENLVRKIIATYQYQGDNTGDTHIYATRAQYNFSHDLETPSWAALSYWQEDQGALDYELYSADFLLSLGENTRIDGEYAYSSQGNQTDAAYRLNATSQLSPSIQANAYYQSVEENFLNNAATSYTPGQTRLGASLTAQLSETTRTSFSYDYEANFGTESQIRTTLFDPFNPLTDLLSPKSESPSGNRVDNELSEFQAEVQQDIGDVEASIAYVNRSRQDRVNNLFEGDASQLVTGVKVPLSETLTFRAQNELNLDESDPIYPNRTTLGVEWTVQPGVKLRLAHQFLDGGLLESNTLTSLETVTERQLGENTTLSSRYSIVGGYNQTRGQSAIGLNHRLTLAPNLNAHLGYEQITNSFLTPTASGVRFTQPYTPGQSSESLGIVAGESYSIGVEYTPDGDFQASARIEHRERTTGENTVIRVGAAGKFSPSLTGLIRYHQASGANLLLEDLNNTANLKLGLAYRNPENDQFNGLLSYEYRYNPSTIPETLLFNSGNSFQDHVFAVEGIYAPSWQWEFYGKYAFRYNQTELAETFSEDSLIHLGQLRATYRFAYRWDVAAESRWIGQGDVNFNEWGWVVDLGYYLTPDLRLGLGYAFGSVDDADFTGYRSSEGLFLGVTFKINELFGNFGQQTPVESVDSSSD
ncbi:Ig-like domain-containing protein [Spirulina sp. CS-785/01]|uniref:Ig-like domain-containing protein n=1 Tax=Spirulina sp. CS-785/01 TaxID=3021716 RepID=UPI0023309F49|nr:Ig-like domain-containing protein [Spirulina sp. CS-785/01]MDB9315837.1 Ig-like domain-containing protein [Spirulina sp. CS-785/01]